MNKIEVFNYVIKLHDRKNKKYNERVADLLLSNNNDEFNIYYDIYARIKEIINIYPYLFSFNETEENKYESINRFSFKVKDDTDLTDLCNFLNEKLDVYSNNYCTSVCKFKKNSEKKIIFVEIKIKSKNLNLKQSLKEKGGKN